MTAFVNRRFSIVLCCCLCVFAGDGVAHGENIEITGQTMGTYYRVLIDSPPDSFLPESLQTKIKARLADLNAQMSTWDKTSEISKFNTHDATDWFDVSAEFAAVADTAKKISEATDRAFDPTVEPLIRLWGFGDSRKQKVPDDAAIAAATAACGMQHLEVRLDPPALRKSLSGLQLNLSAITKGFAVDALADLLIEDGLDAFVVDIGGENRAGAHKASGASWKLGIESPLGGLKRVVLLTDQAIATSGSYRNNFQVDGETYSHAIDPATGWPVKNPPASVSVIADSCMAADAWATAMMVLGVEKGINLAEAEGLSVVFQQINADMTITETASGALVEDRPDDGGQADQGTHLTQGAAWFPFVAAAVIFLIAVAGMAVGTILQNRSLKGSCGGLAAMPGSEGKSICELCTIPKDECTNAELKEKMQAAAAAAGGSECQTS